MGIEKYDIIEKKFVFYWHFVGWSCISLGVHVCFACPNVELHLPFGFIRLGWHGVLKKKDKK